MTWPSTQSTFFLNRLCEFIKNAVPMDKGFRLKNLLAEVVFTFYKGRVATRRSTAIKEIWRARWV
jgi:hypothetical protein